MTKQEMRDMLQKLERALDALSYDVNILSFRGSSDFALDIHLYSGESVATLSKREDFGEFDNGTKCIKHSRCIDGVDVFFLEEEQNGSQKAR